MPTAIDAEPGNHHRDAHIHIGGYASALHLTFANPASGYACPAVYLDAAAHYNANAHTNPVAHARLAR